MRGRKPHANEPEAGHRRSRQAAPQCSRAQAFPLDPDLRIISHLDRAALAAYCQAYGRWVEAERQLKDTLTLIRLPSGYIQPSPLLTIANKQLELMHKYMGDLGLSPASRSRVSTMPALGPKPWEFGQDWDRGDRNGPDEFFGD